MAYRCQSPRPSSNARRSALGGTEVGDGCRTIPSLLVSTFAAGYTSWIFFECFTELGFEHAAFLDAVAETSVERIPIQCEVVMQVAECSGQPHVHVVGEH